jgi:hypothetical protein
MLPASLENATARLSRGWQRPRAARERLAGRRRNFSAVRGGSCVGWALRVAGLGVRLAWTGEIPRVNEHRSGWIIDLSPPALVQQGGRWLPRCRPIDRYGPGDNSLPASHLAPSRRDLRKDAREMRGAGQKIAVDGREFAKAAPVIVHCGRQLQSVVREIVSPGASFTVADGHYCSAALH